MTAVEVGHGKRRHLLSDYTFAVRRSAEDDELLNIGKAYSGLTDRELTELTEWFKAHTIQEYAHGRVRVVEPTIVIEVTFDRVQPSKRHKSGYALRFPRILRLRPDKSTAEIDTLETVRQLVETGDMGQKGPKIFRPFLGPITVEFTLSRLADNALIWRSRCTVHTGNTNTQETAVETAPHCALDAEVQC